MDDIEILNACYDEFLISQIQEQLCQNASEENDWAVAAALAGLSIIQATSCWNDLGDRLDDQARLLESIAECSNSTNEHFCEKSIPHLQAASDLACTITEDPASCSVYDDKADSISSAIEDFIDRQSGCLPCDVECDAELESAMACAQVNNSSHRFRATQRRSERLRSLKAQSLSGISHSGRNVATIGQTAYSQSLEIIQSLKALDSSCLNSNLQAIGYSLGGFTGVGVGGSNP